MERSPGLVASFAGSRAEIAWLLGTKQAASLPSRDVLDRDASSIAFRDGGFYVMLGRRDHVFVDCGPVGLAGRGGHGHNDLLSFEAMLDGLHLVTDCGAFVYTADYAAQEIAFRPSTAYHNTPQVDAEEINRFIRPDDLWHLHADARHELVAWELGADTTRFVGRHTGYLRLPDPVHVTRELMLDARAHSLVIVDRLHASGKHTVEVPLHLAPGIAVTKLDEATLLLRRALSMHLVGDAGVERRDHRCAHIALVRRGDRDEAHRVASSLARRGGAARLDHFVASIRTNSPKRSNRDRISRRGHNDFASRSAAPR